MTATPIKPRPGLERYLEIVARRWSPVKHSVVIVLWEIGAIGLTAPIKFEVVPDLFLLNVAVWFPLRRCRSVSTVCLANGLSGLVVWPTEQLQENETSLAIAPHLRQHLNRSHVVMLKLGASGPTVTMVESKLVLVEFSVMPRALHVSSPTRHKIAALWVLGPSGSLMRLDGGLVAEMSRLLPVANKCTPRLNARNTATWVHGLSGPIVTAPQRIAVGLALSMTLLIAKRCTLRRKPNPVVKLEVGLLGAIV